MTDEEWLNATYSDGDRSSTVECAAVNRETAGPTPPGHPITNPWAEAVRLLHASWARARIRLMEEQVYSREEYLERRGSEGCD